MEKYKTVRLGDVCEIVSGSTPKTEINEYWNGTFNWVTPAELSEDKHLIYETKRKITQLAIDKTHLSILPKGTVLLSSRAPIGKLAIAGTDMYCNQGFKNLICSEAIFNKYVFWFLRGKVEYLNNLGRGATFKEISKTIVENIYIPLPPLSEQKHIASVLDKCTKLIAKNKQMLEKYDTLIKSRFIEMFGDPESNNLNWEKQSIGENCFVTKLAGFEYSKYIHYLDTGDVVMVKAQNVKNGKLNEKDMSYITKEVSDALPRSQLVPNDVVLTYVGANIGDVALIDDKYKYHLAPNVAKIRPDTKVYNSLFLVHLLLQLKMYIVRNSADTAKAAIGMEKIRQLIIPVPPIELQNDFASFVQQIDKSKFAVQKSLEKAETLYKSLMQEYFG